MLKNVLLLSLFCTSLVVLVSCSNKDASNEVATKTIIEDEQVQTNGQKNTLASFTTFDGKAQQVDVPKKDETAILEAFDQYISSFNDKDLVAYRHVLSTTPTGFNLEEDLAQTKQLFEQFNIVREAENPTITYYDGNIASVFAAMTIKIHQGEYKAVETGKQITQFTKEQGQWRVTSIQAMSNFEETAK